MGVNVGFTGSRKGITAKQLLVLIDLFKELNPRTFHHGGCEGADTEAHKIAGKLGISRTVHPPIDKKAIGDFTGAEHIEEEREFLERDRDIVDAGSILIATPKESLEQRRSGTWYTIRYARKQGKEIFIIYPDGSIEGG